jgi:hypothetical protein
VRAVLDAFLRRKVSAGDQVVVNDPFAGGTHLNDVTFVAGLPRRSARRWAANRSPSRDSGRRRAGSMPATRLRIYQEGLRIRPRRVLTGRARCDPPTTHARRAGRRPRRAGRSERPRRQPAHGARRDGELLDEVLAYGERRMRRRAMRDGRGRSRTSSTRPVRPPISNVQRAWSPSLCPVIASRSTSRVPTRSAGQRERGRGGSRSRRSRLLCEWRPIRRFRPMAALRPVEVIASVGTIVGHSGSGRCRNVEVSQRVADVCLGAPRSRRRAPRRRLRER